MLDDPAVVAGCGQCGGETSTIFAHPILVRFVRCAMPIFPPPLTRRMRYHWEWSSIVSGVPQFIPRVNHLLVVIPATSLHVKSGNRLSRRAFELANGSGQDFDFASRAVAGKTHRCVISPHGLDVSHFTSPAAANFARTASDALPSCTSREIEARQTPAREAIS